MSHQTMWYTCGEAHSAFHLETSLILQWVEQGSVRSQLGDTRSMLLNADDLKRMAGI